MPIPPLRRTREKGPAMRVLGIEYLSGTSSFSQGHPTSSSLPKNRRWERGYKGYAGSLTTKGLSVPEMVTKRRWGRQRCRDRRHFRFAGSSLGCKVLSLTVRAVSTFPCLDSSASGYVPARILGKD